MRSKRIGPKLARTELNGPVTANVPIQEFLSVRLRSQFKNTAEIRAY